MERKGNGPKAHEPGTVRDALAKAGYQDEIFRNAYRIIAGDKFTKQNDAAVARGISRVCGIQITNRQVEKQRARLGMLSCRRDNHARHPYSAPQADIFQNTTAKEPAALIDAIAAFIDARIVALQK